MTHRGLILCMAMAVVASGALITRHSLHKRAWQREGRQRKPFSLGLVGKPRVDVSLTSDSLPM